MKKKNRDEEFTYTRRQFSQKLRRLSDAVESGGPFRIQPGNERIHVSSDVTFNIEHERSADIEELEFQLWWKNL